MLADAEPIARFSDMDGDSQAWYSGLCEALVLNEIERIPTRLDDSRTHSDGSYSPYEYTMIGVESLKAFCEARKRRPEFLM